MHSRHSWQKEDAKISAYVTMVLKANEMVVDYHESLFHRRYRTLEDAESCHAQTIANLPQIIFTCNQCHYKEQLYFIFAIASISINAFLGRVLTAIVERAGL